MFGLSEHRQVPDRITDVLPWAALVAPDTVLNKDDRLVQSTIQYRGPDLDSSTDEELVVKAAHLNNVLRRFGSGWALYAEAKRVQVFDYPESTFPDEVSHLIDVERQFAFNEHAHFESTYFLTLIYLPPAQNVNRLTKMFLAGEAESEVNYEKMLEHFRHAVKQAVDMLLRNFPEARTLTDSDLLTYLHSTISTTQQQVFLPEIPMYLDSVLADTSLVGGFYPKLGDHNLMTIGILGFPGSSQPCLLDAINHVPIEYRWVTRCVFLDKVDAKKELETYQRKWFAKRKGIGSIIRELLTKEESALHDSEALQKAHDAEAALEELGTDEVSFGYITTVFVIKDTNQERLRAQAAEVERIINSLGFTTRRETVNAVDAWLGSIPGNVRNNVRRPIVNTMNLAHLIPGASAAWGGPRRNVHLDGPVLLTAETGGSTPFRLSLHVGDVGHTLILGPTGSGKSTLLNIIEAQFLRYPDAQVYIFDKGGSAFTLTTAVGGDYYDLGAEGSKLFLQPLANIDADPERNWAHDWLLGIAQKEGVSITPEIKGAVWEALASLRTAPPEQRTIKTLTIYLQDIRLRKALEPYTQDGPYGHLFDSRRDTLAYSRWQCFEMERLMETPKIVAPVLAYLFHRLEQRFTGAPTLLVLDEAWLFLDDPLFASKIREWLKTLRKKNVAVVFATQSLTDVDASTIAATIKEACFTKIYLPNAVALQPDQREMYRKFGLNKTQTEILAYALPKQDYYYVSPLGNRLFSLDMAPIALAYCASASPENQALTRDLIRQSISVPDFNRRYLTAKNLTEWADRLTQEKEVA